MNEVKESLTKNQIKKILNASGENWLGFIVLSFIAAVAVIIINLCAQDHIVRCYYLQTTSTQSGLAYKVMADIDWHDDQAAFTSASPNESLAVIADLKQCASK